MSLIQKCRVDWTSHRVSRAVRSTRNFRWIESRDSKTPSHHVEQGSAAVSSPTRLLTSNKHLRSVLG